MGNAWNHFFDPEVHPLPSEVGTKGNFDPKLGFDGVRKQRGKLTLLFTPKYIL